MSREMIRQMRTIVTDQFNQEQLVIARTVSQRIARELTLLKRELIILADCISAAPFGAKYQNEDIQRSFSKILESGVWKIEIVDFAVGRKRSFMPHGSRAAIPLRRNSDPMRPIFPGIQRPDPSIFLRFNSKLPFLH